MTEREQMLQKVRIHEFMLFEVALYLDTHKTDQEALCFYQKHKAEAEKLRAEFVEKYGPLAMSDSSSTRCWEWSSGPWPWEYVAN